MSESVKAILISVIRTTVMPLVAGSVLSLVALAGVDDPSIEVRAAVASVLAMAWYILARFLETKNPYWGVMLLVAVQPHYDTDTETQIVSSVQRTVVPILVGWIAAVLVRYGINLDDASLALALQGAITTVYYGVLRKIEATQPRAGVLLGGQAAPTY
jgi:hypothetical protein